MATTKNLIHSNNQWTSSEDQKCKSKTYTFVTKDLYVTDNIKMTINVPGVELQKGESFWIKDANGLVWTFTIDTNGNMIII